MDDAAELAEAARDLLGAAVMPMPGGERGETFRVEVAGEPMVLRLYLRDPERVAVDVSLLELVRGLLPVPQVLDWRTAFAGGFPYVLTELLPGERLDRVLPTAGPELQATLGANVGTVLARLSGVPYLHPGTFTGTELTLLPAAAGQLDLEVWVSEHLERAALTGWSDEDREGLAAAASYGAYYLDEIRRTCLVHADLGLSNLLVDPGTGGITGLVDWEGAHAGLPVTDLGRLFRAVDAGPFVDEVLAALRSQAPSLPPELLATAAAADLFALVEAATQPGVPMTATVSAARERLRETAAARRPLGPIVRSPR